MPTDYSAISQYSIDNKYDPLNREDQDYFLARMKKHDEERDNKKIIPPGKSSSFDSPYNNKPSNKEERQLNLEEKLTANAFFFRGRARKDDNGLEGYISKEKENSAGENEKEKGYNHIGKFYKVDNYVVSADEDGIIHIYAPKEHSLKGFTYDASNNIYIVGSGDSTIESYNEVKVHELGHKIRHKLFHTPQMEEMINSIMTGVGMERYRPLEIQKPVFTSMYGTKSYKEIESKILGKSSPKGYLN